MMKRLGLFLVILSLSAGCIKINKSTAASPVSSNKKSSSDWTLLGGTFQGKGLSLKGEVSTYMGSAGQSGNSNGTKDTARFALPYHATTDGKAIYLTDYQNDGIRKIDLETNNVSTIVARPSQFTGVTTDGHYLYAFDLMTHTLNKIDLETEAISILAGSGAMGSADGIGIAASFGFAEGMTTDGKFIYLNDSTGFIRKINCITGHVSTLPLPAFSIIEGIVTDGDYLYAEDTGDQKIYKISIGDNSHSVIYTGTNLNGALTMDGKNLYFADAHVIKKIDFSTNIVSDIAGSSTLTGSVDGKGVLARFNIPHAMLSDGKKLFVLDMQNNIVRSIE